MAVYLGVYVWRSTRETLQISPTVKTTVSETALMTGLAVRRETVLTSERAYVFVSADDGEQVAKGDAVGNAMDTEAAQERAGRKKQLENEIKHMESLLSELSSVDDLTERDGAIRAAVLSLSRGVSTRELANLEGLCTELGSLMLSRKDDSVSQEALEALKAELDSMNSSTYSDSEEILAPDSGLFTTILDGYEHLTPEELSGITPSALQGLLSGAAVSEAGAVGKLVAGWRWYFAALIDKADAETLTVGRYVSVSFGRHYSSDVSMRVESISAPDSGKCAVVLSTLNELGGTLALRRSDAEMRIEEHTGLRVPTKALHVDEDGDSFVYVLTGRKIEKKYVQTICETGDYYLVEQSALFDGLREGDDVVVRGKNVYEGMLVDG